MPELMEIIYEEKLKQMQLIMLEQKKGERRDIITMHKLVNQLGSGQ